jgi:hypothetical protein
MAYQPKSYRKFLAGSVSAALVASAVGPVVANAASFSDVKPDDSHKANIEALVELGYIKGFNDGTFKPYQSITRGQVAKIFARILKDRGFQVPEDKKAFDDVPVDSQDQELVEAAAIVKAAGVMTGTDGKLNPGQPITRQQMAKVLVEAFDLTKPADFTSKITDLDKADAYARDYIQTLEANGVTVVTEFNPKGNVTRAAFASFVKRALDASKVEAELKVESVSAVGAKKLEVKFNKAVDTTKATFEVKKGSVKVNISSITWNEDKTAATIELAGKLTAGEYTVNVSGLDEEVLSGKTTVEDEKVAKIEILSTEAPLVDSADSDDDIVDDLEVGYRVLNQYGEDITKTTTLTTSSNNVKVNPATGTVTIVGDYNTTTNKTVTFTLIHVQTATTATATVTAVSESKVSEVTIKGLYNKDGKTLNETTNLASDKFYVELEVKDQYGKVITDANKINKELLITETNPNVVDAASSVTVEDVNGNKKVLIPLTGTPTVGENVVTVIATSTGKSASYKVEVAESTRAYNVDVVAPELAVANEQVLIPINVTDKEGNLVTDLDVLKSSTRGIKVTVGGEDKTSALIVKDGKVYLPQTFASAGYQSIVVISNATQKVDTLTLEVKEAAKPVIITGVDADWNKAIRTSTGQLVLTPADLIVEDQYGRVMKDTDFAATLGTNPGQYQVLVDDVDPAATSAVDVAPGGKLAGASDSVTISATVNKGSEKIKLQLAKVKSDSTVEPIAGTEYEFTVETTDSTSFKSYEFAPIGKMYDEVGAGDSTSPAYNKGVVVYGVLDSGKKIELDPTEYSVKAPSFLDYNSNVSGNDVFELNTDAGDTVPYAEKATEYTAKVEVVINATGQKLTQDVVISKAAPKVTAFKLVDVTATDAATKLDTQAELEKATEVSGPITLASGQTAFDNSDLTIDRSLVVLDSYGVYHLASNIVNFTSEGAGQAKVTSDVELTIKPVKDVATSPATPFSITGNGTKAATIASGLDAGDEFDVIISIDGVEKTYRFKK